MQSKRRKVRKKRSRKAIMQYCIVAAVPNHLDKNRLTRKDDVNGKHVMLPISTVYSKQLIIPHVHLCEKMIRMKLYCIKNFAKTIFYKIMT